MTTETPPPPNPRSRLEDEVLEILMRSDRPPTSRERLRSWLRRHRQPASRRSSGGLATLIQRLDDGLWLPVCVGLAIVAFLVRDESRLLSTILSVAVAGVIVLQIARSVTSPKRATSMRWRGREIDVSPRPRPLWMDRVWRKPRKPRR